MLSKVIAHGADRDEALQRLDRALAQTAVLGVQTNIEFLRFLLADDRVRAGDLDTALLDERVVDFAPLPVPDDVLAAGGLYRQWALAQHAKGDLWAAPTGWRVGGVVAPVRTELGNPLRTETVSVWGPPETATVQVGDGEIVSASAQVGPDAMSVTLAGVRRGYRWAEEARHLWIADERGTWHLREAEEQKIHRAAGERQAEVLSPMPGNVIAVQAESGAEVAEGDVVVVVEAMKMEHSLAAPASGRVEVLVSVGDQVKVDQVLARLVQDSTARDQES
jgi:acetyl-CoA/propionyl-CoA carboxylase biotin carboxyl carrier protein